LTAYIGTRRRPVRRHHSWPSNTYRSATIPHDWYSRVRNNRSGSSKVNDCHAIWKAICDFLLVGRPKAAIANVLRVKTNVLFSNHC